MKLATIDETQLRRLIEDEDRPQAEVAKMFGVHRDTINRRCKKLGLKTAGTGPRPGERHFCWKGGVVIRGGYRYVYEPDHPHATQLKQVLEHRLVMEEKLGRYLTPKEVVHHVNKDTLDNRPENLVLYDSNARHLQEHLEGDPIHRLCCKHSLRRKTILGWLRSGDWQQFQKLPRWKNADAVLVLRSCGQLRILGPDEQDLPTNLPEGLRDECQ
jgi:predicted transcriptional regulator